MQSYSGVVRSFCGVFAEFFRSFSELCGVLKNISKSHPTYPKSFWASAEFFQACPKPQWTLSEACVEFVRSFFGLVRSFLKYVQDFARYVLKIFT